MAEKQDCSVETIALRMRKSTRNFDADVPGTPRNRETRVAGKGGVGKRALANKIDGIFPALHAPGIAAIETEADTSGFRDLRFRRHTPMIRGGVIRSRGKNLRLGFARSEA